MPGLTVASAMATSTRQGSREPRVVKPAPKLQSSSGLFAGRILWLPPKSEITASSAAADDSDSDSDSDSKLDEGMCNHPVVVLSPHADGGKVVYLIMTSFNSQTLESRFPGHDRASTKNRQPYLPIEPAPAHPDNGKRLRLARGAPAMRKESYVRTRPQHRIRHAVLRPYERRRGPDLFLDPDSYRELIAYAMYTPPPPHPASRAVPVSVPVPMVRERSGSYSEFVSVQRGLESGVAGTSPVTTTAAAAAGRGYVPLFTTTTTTTRDTTGPRYSRYVPAASPPQPSERDRLLLHGSSSSYGGGHPAYGHYSSPQPHSSSHPHRPPPSSPGSVTGTTVCQMLFTIAAVALSGCAVWYLVSWLIGDPKLLQHQHQHQHQSPGDAIAAAAAAAAAAQGGRGAVVSRIMTIWSRGRRGLEVLGRSW
ncbi:uncharacterized protein GGS25DRAFT_256295 [Hypoxylon fragiforme]|uniref:uncharacterized protein n=1 Tax=Hypoxylon fragiforme TaxID=63214 RepID=UPI0020C7278A|nr:uncharacterized protein GGS25DRAFT_256295 [Hypoxylon fragiforme]KAI2610314.1 hypothetical protein GGS25DRAFT_256295 [Hypoxylon fragiforme]